EPLQAVLDFAVDLIERQRHREAPLERTQSFQICLHPIRFSCVGRRARLGRRQFAGALVRKERLELSRLSAPEPKSGASTNSATFALDTFYNTQATSFYPSSAPRAP